MSEDQQILQQMQRLVRAVSRRIEEVTGDCKQDISLTSKRILLAELSEFVRMQQHEAAELRVQILRSQDALDAFASLEKKLQQIARLISSSN